MSVIVLWRAKRSGAATVVCPSFLIVAHRRSTGPSAHISLRYSRVNSPTVCQTDRRAALRSARAGSQTSYLVTGIPRPLNRVARMRRPSLRRSIGLHTLLVEAYAVPPFRSASPFSALTRHEPNIIEAHWPPRTQPNELPRSAKSRAHILRSLGKTQLSLCLAWSRRVPGK